MTLIRDVQSGECNAYVHFDAVYRLDDLFHPERVENLQLQGKVIRLKLVTHNMTDCGGLGRFLDQVREYTLEHERKNQSKGRQRFGWLFDMMLPEGEYQGITLKKLSRKFWRYVVGRETNLRFASWAYEIPKKKKIQMMRIWIYDREYFLHKEKYLRDIWMDPAGRVCRKNSPGAVLKCRKGQIIPDRPAVRFKRTKTRCFEYKTTGFEERKQFYKESWVQALRRVTYTKVVPGRYFTRLSMKNSYNRWLRRIIVAGNRVRQAIQNELLFWMNIVKGDALSGFRDWVVDSYQGGQSYGGPGGMKMKMLNELFDKYAAIFRKNRFIWKDEYCRLTGIRCDCAERNCVKLLDIFRNDMDLLLMEFQLMGT